MAWAAGTNPGTLSMTVDGGQTWTLIINDASFKVWWAINNGTLGTVTMHQTNSNTILAGMAAYSNISAATPIDATPTLHTGTLTNATVTQLTTVTDDSLRVVIAFFTDARATDLEWYTAQPSGYTKRLGQGGSAWTYTIYVGDKLQSIAGLSPAENFTSGAKSTYLSHIPLRVKPPTQATIAGAMSGFSGTVIAEAMAHVDEFGEINANLSGFNGTVVARASHQSFRVPVRKYIWVYNLAGDKINVLD